MCTPPLSSCHGTPASLSFPAAEGRQQGEVRQEGERVLRSGRPGVRGSRPRLRGGRGAAGVHAHQAPGSRAEGKKRRERTRIGPKYTWTCFVFVSNFWGRNGSHSGVHADQALGPRRAQGKAREDWNIFPNDESFFIFVRETCVYNVRVSGLGEKGGFTASGLA